MNKFKKVAVDACEDDAAFVLRFDDEWRTSGEHFQELIVRLGYTLENGGKDTKGLDSSEPIRTLLEAAYHQIGGRKPFLHRSAFRHFRNGKTHKPSKGGALQLALACYAVQASDHHGAEQVTICRQAAGLFPCLLRVDYNVDRPTSPLSNLTEILDRRSRGDEDFEAYFFRHRAANSSHYAVYRYSTFGEQVVKTILVVNRPKKPGENWTFRNTMRGTEERVEVQRNGEGLIIALADSVYAIGQAYRFVKGKKAAEVADMGDPLGLIALVIEKNAFNITDGVPMPGLILSLARQGQPIVARAAVVPLGEFDRDWADELAATTAGIFKEADLEGELGDLSASVAALGETRNSSPFAMQSLSPQGSGFFLALAHDILDAMNNSPAAHLARADPSSPKEVEAGKGAIETHPIGNDRRPRP